MSRHGPAVLDRRAGVALWRQLRDDLVLRIEGGEFPERFPGEMELAEEYAVSRHTVREALRRLRTDGAIDSSRGRSSVARPGVISQQLGALSSLFHVLESRGIRQESRLLAADLRADADAAARLGLRADLPLVRIERLRLGDGVPIAWDVAWLDPELGAPLFGADLTHSALYDAWQRAAGVRLTSGRETIRAVVPSPPQRELLGMGRGEAALLLERTGVVGDRAVEYRVTLVRGSRFSFSAEWTSGRSYRAEVAR